MWRNLAGNPRFFELFNTFPQFGIFRPRFDGHGPHGLEFLPRDGIHIPDQSLQPGFHEPVRLLTQAVSHAGGVLQNFCQTFREYRIHFHVPPDKPS